MRLRRKHSSLIPMISKYVTIDYCGHILQLEHLISNHFSYRVSSITAYKTIISDTEFVLPPDTYDNRIADSIPHTRGREIRATYFRTEPALVYSGTHHKAIAVPPSSRCPK